MESTEIIVSCAFLGLCLVAAAIALMEGILFHWKQKPEKERSFTMRGDSMSKYLTPVASFVIEEQRGGYFCAGLGANNPLANLPEHSTMVVQSACRIMDSVHILASSESGFCLGVFLPAAEFEGIEMCELIGCSIDYSTDPDRDPK